MDKIHYSQFSINFQKKFQSEIHRPDPDPEIFLGANQSYNLSHILQNIYDIVYKLLTFAVERVIAPRYHKERENGKEKIKDT